MPAKPRFSLSADDILTVREQLKNMPAGAAPIALGVFAYTLETYKEEMKRRSSTGPLVKRTGRLMRSWGPTSGKMATGDTLNNLSAFIASYSVLGDNSDPDAPVYAKAMLHEFGGHVTPKTGSRGWIFIPTDPNRNANKQAIYSVREVLADGGRYVNYNREKKREAQRGQLGGGFLPPLQKAVIDGKQSNAWNLVVNAGNVPMFIQVKWADYPARLGFYDAGLRYAEMIVPRLADAVVQYWQLQK